MTWSEFADLCGMSGAASSGVPSAPEDFDIDVLIPFTCLWHADDGSDETSYVAIVQDVTGGCWLVTGSHDYTGWDCQGGWSIDAGPVRPEVAFSDFFVAENMIEWDRPGFERARDVRAR